jgi:TatD DNase family protein
VDLYPEPKKLVTEAARNEWHVVAVTNAPSVFEHTRNLADAHPTVHAAVGLHPQLVSTRSNERGMLKELLATTRFVGEIGLDYQTKNEQERALQREVFLEVVETCSMLGNRILTIHSRRSSKDVLSILGESFRGTAILHYFSGLKSEVSIATKRGYYFSINPAMTRSKSGQQLIACMEPERVLTESDGPFVKLGRRPAEPRDTSVVIEHLAGVWACSVESAAEKVLANFERVACTNTEK